MPHFVYEYSANLPDDLLDLPGLMEKMHEVAASTGEFPLPGMRSRAIRCEHFRVADGDPQKGFVNLSMKVGAGRPTEVRQECSKLLSDALLEHLRPLLQAHPVAVSFEMRELDEHAKFNFRNY